MHSKQRVKESKESSNNLLEMTRHGFGKEWVWFEKLGHVNCGIPVRHSSVKVKPADGQTGVDLQMVVRNVQSQVGAVFHCGTYLPRLTHLSIYSTFNTYYVPDAALGHRNIGL